MNWKPAAAQVAFALVCFGLGWTARKPKTVTVEIAAKRETEVSTKTATVTDTVAPRTDTKTRTVIKYLPSGERTIVREVERKQSAERITENKTSAVAATDRQSVTIKEHEPQRPWGLSGLLGLEYGGRKVYGLHVSRDLGPLRLGVQLQRSDAWAGLITLGVRF